MHCIQPASPEEVSIATSLRLVPTSRTDFTDIVEDKIPRYCTEAEHTAGKVGNCVEAASAPTHTML